MRAAELCAGYGGLALAVNEVFGSTTAWFSEFEAAPSKILAHHWPTVPNHGDMTKIDWAAVEPVDIIAGGTPCQDLSGAGRRKGMSEGTRSNLWVQMREAIAIIKPKYVVWENVRGAYSAGADSELESIEGRVGGAGGGGPVLRALGRVLGDLSDLGYDCQWRGLRAADVGAPHGRFRVFILATRTADTVRGGSGGRATLTGHGIGTGPDAPADRADDRPGEPGTIGQAGDLANANGFGREWGGQARNGRSGPPDGDQPHVDWGIYTPAIHRWEALRGTAPNPTEPTGRNGNHRLSARFAEWMMGVPDGWIVDVPGVTRNEALKAAGNGVVPQQAIAALRDMLNTQEAAA